MIMVMIMFSQWLLVSLKFGPVVTKRTRRGCSLVLRGLQATNRFDMSFSVRGDKNHVEIASSPSTGRTPGELTAQFIRSWGKLRVWRDPHKTSAPYSSHLSSAIVTNKMSSCESKSLCISTNAKPALAPPLSTAARLRGETVENNRSETFLLRIPSYRLVNGSIPQLMYHLQQVL